MVEIIQLHCLQVNSVIILLHHQLNLLCSAVHMLYIVVMVFFCSNCRFLLPLPSFISSVMLSSSDVAVLLLLDVDREVVNVDLINIWVAPLTTVQLQHMECTVLHY